MSMEGVNIHVARRVADRVNDDWGERVCTALEVMQVARGQSPVNEAVESRILQELEEYGFSA